MPIAVFPDPTRSGPRYTHYRKHPPDWERVVNEHTFDDEGASYNTNASTAPQRWDLEYVNITPLEAGVLAAHRNSAKHNLEGFDFYEKDATLNTNVHYESFEQTHDANKSWIQNVRITLVKRPA